MDCGFEGLIDQRLGARVGNVSVDGLLHHAAGDFFAFLSDPVPAPQKQCGDTGGQSNFAAILLRHHHGDGALIVRNAGEPGEASEQGGANPGNGGFPISAEKPDKHYKRRVSIPRKTLSRHAARPRKNVIASRGSVFRNVILVQNFGQGMPAFGDSGGNKQADAEGELVRQANFAKQTLPEFALDFQH